MRVSIQSKENTVVFELNDSRAAKDLYAQLPLNVTVADYGGIEKVFNPPNRLATSNTPLAKAKIGTFAYYAPWNNVVMFYADYGSASGLYELGKVISGIEHISGMLGTIQINAVKHEED